MAERIKPSGRMISVTSEGMISSTASASTVPAESSSSSSETRGSGSDGTFLGNVVETRGCSSASSSLMTAILPGTTIRRAQCLHSTIRPSRVALTLYRVPQPMHRSSTYIGPVATSVLQSCGPSPCLSPRYGGEEMGHAHLDGALLHRRGLLELHVEHALNDAPVAADVPLGIRG